MRNDGALDASCNAVNPGPKCNTISVGGQRYLSFEDGSPLCCRCCSWENGGGPVDIESTLMKNATYMGTKLIRGQTCTSWEIAEGSERRYVHVRSSDGQLCELDDVNITDFLEFIPSSFKSPVPPDYASNFFTPPTGCSKWCGPHGDCKAG